MATIFFNCSSDPNKRLGLLPAKPICVKSNQFPFFLSSLACGSFRKLTNRSSVPPWYTFNTFPLGRVTWMEENAAVFLPASGAVVVSFVAEGVVWAVPQDRERKKTISARTTSVTRRYRPLFF